VGPNGARRGTQTVHVPGTKRCTSNDEKEVALPHIDVGFAEAKQRLYEQFPTRERFMLWQLAHYASTDQTFDATFYGREPSLEVTLTQKFAYAFMDALASERTSDLSRLIRRVCFSDGTSIGMTGIWTLNYMPRDLDISNVDLSPGEQRIGDQGETMREMISNTYRCRSRAEEDFFLARFIAS